MLGRLRPVQEGVAGEGENGKLGVQRDGELRPDAVLMDITMPVMEGISAANAILLSDPKAVVLMCTALGQQGMVIDAIKAGVKDYIVKPFQPERVLEGLIAAGVAPEPLGPQEPRMPPAAMGRY